MPPAQSIPGEGPTASFAVILQEVLGLLSECQLLKCKTARQIQICLQT